MKCPYCKSKDIVEWRIEQEERATYRCYTCGGVFEERDIKGCGKQIFRYGDNYPVFNKGEDKMKFERGNEVIIKIDTGLYYEGEIITCDYNNNLYRVKYNDGFRFTEDVFKGEQLELKEDIDPSNSIPLKAFKSDLLYSRTKFKKMGIVPKAKKDDLINLWIDLWELLKDKINGKKEIKK